MNEIVGTAPVRRFRMSTNYRSPAEVFDLAAQVVVTRVPGRRPARGGPLDRHRAASCAVAEPGPAGRAGGRPSVASCWTRSRARSG